MAAATELPANAHAARPPSPISWARELRETLALASPLIVAQLAQMALFTTDAIMMGWLGPKYLGAGMLTVSFLHPFFLFGVGVLSAVAPMVAQAKGAGDAASVRRSSCVVIPRRSGSGSSGICRRWRTCPMRLLMPANRRQAR